tara:strand:+ start:2084 stop:2590 length:507 start_codon:yes stop_codon:yes gene_type:complete
VSIFCLTFLGGGNYTQMKTVEFVDLERFMGDWYVIANIPTFIEKRATNAIESYELMEDGKTIKTTFSFFNDSPDGKKKVYNPTGFVYNSETNAEWRMQFIWPFKSVFLIIDLDEGYNYTVIGIPSKKYVWIMAREPALSEQLYETILENLSEIGYNTSLISKVPQVWK